MFDDLKYCDFTGVLLKISDGYNGIRKATKSLLNRVSWQKCCIYYIRNNLKHVSKNIKNIATSRRHAEGKESRLKNITDSIINNISRT